MKPAARILAVQLAPILVLAKFGVLGLFDIIHGTSFATLKTYALALGLVSPFIVAVSLRARIVLLSDAISPEDGLAMQRLLLLASVVGLGGAYVILSGTQYILLGLLIAGTKLTENLLDAELAMLQRKGKRDDAIALQFSRNGFMLLAYVTLFLFGSLAITIASELVIGCLALVSFRHALRPGRAIPGSYQRVIREATSISVAAFFNGLVVTLIIRKLVGSSHVAAAETVGLVAGMFTISGRLLTNNSLFYRKPVERLLTRASASAAIYVGLAAILALTAVFIFAYPRVSSPYQAGLLVLLIGVLLVLNSYALTVRQSLLLQGSRNLPVIILHIGECLAVMLLFVPGADPTNAIAALVLSRVLRTAVFSYHHRPVPKAVA